MENDLISRADAIEAIRSMTITIGGNNVFPDNVKSSVLDALEFAPSVEAEPVRHGRWVLETNSGYRDSYFEDYILVVSISAKCSECGENHGRTGHVYGDEFMGEEDGKRPVENVEEKIEQTRNKYLDWLRSGRCKLMNYCPSCGAKMDAKEDA